MNELTNFPNGVSSFGVPLIGSGQIPITNGSYYFVDGTNGNDGNDGNSIVSALKTITAAINKAVPDDVILVLPGIYSEVAIADVANISIIALGTATKSVQWTSDTDTITLTLAANYIEVAGFYFKPPTHTAGTPAAIELSNANYAHIHNNRFQGQTGSYNAIYSPVCNSDNVIIENNEFRYLNTATFGAAILGVEAGGLSYSAWKILNNIFDSCVTNVNINGRVCLVQGNHFGVNGINASSAVAAVTTLGLDLSGTSSGANKVHGNYLGGAYSATLYKVGASLDDWAGNYNIAGITTANPA